MGSVRQGLSFALVVACCALIIIMLAAGQTFSRCGIQTVQTVRANHAQLEIFRHLLIMLLDMETGTRSYLVTRNETYLDPLRQSEAKLDQVIASLSRDFPVGSPNHDEFKLLLSLIAAERETLILSSSSGNDQTMPQGIGGQPRVAGDLQLFQQTRAIGAHGLYAEIEHVGDGRNGFTLGQAQEDL